MSIDKTIQWMEVQGADVIQNIDRTIFKNIPFLPNYFLIYRYSERKLIVYIPPHIKKYKTEIIERINKYGKVNNYRKTTSYTKADLLLSEDNIKEVVIEISLIDLPSQIEYFQKGYIDFSTSYPSKKQRQYLSSYGNLEEYSRNCFGKKGIFHIYRGLSIETQLKVRDYILRHENKNARNI